MAELVFLAVFALGAGETGPAVRVGSKVFTESVILGEIGRGMIQAACAPAIHRRELGGTQVLFHALESDELDVYAEYTGTIAGEILSGKGFRLWPARISNIMPATTLSPFIGGRSKPFFASKAYRSYSRQLACTESLQPGLLMSIETYVETARTYWRSN